MTKARITVERIPARDLEPGDLFTTAAVPDDYWEKALDDELVIGQRVYVRTNIPGEDRPGYDEEVLRVTIHKTVEVSSTIVDKDRKG